MNLYEWFGVNYQGRFADVGLIVLTICTTINALIESRFAGLSKVALHLNTCFHNSGFFLYI